MKLWSRNSNRSQTEPTSGVDWVVRMRSGSLTKHEREAVRAWLDRSSDNARDLLRAETTWRLSGALVSDELVRCELDELDRLENAPSAEPRHAEAHWGRTGRILAAAGIAACCLWLGLWLYTSGHKTYETAHGEQRVVTLADGSVVALNTDTQLQVNLSANQRDIYLRRGEALFQVTHDAQRPFVVHAGSGYARAVGTRFNVVTAQDQITVSVLEGRVEVSPVSQPRQAAAAQEQSGASATANTVSVQTSAAAHPNPRSPGSGEATLIQAGQSAAYTDTGSLVPPQPLRASTERIVAWREGKLRFEAWRLADAIREYNRYANKPIRLEAYPLKDVQISGVFRIGDSAAFVTALSALVDAKVVEENEALILTAN